MKKHILIFGLVVLALHSYSQGVFITSATGGNWTSTGTWTLVGGSDVDGIPDSDDDVYILDCTNGVTVNANVVVSMLHVEDDVAGNLKKGGFGSPRTITISGSLLGDDGTGTPSAPTVNVFNDTNLTIILTGGGTVISDWSSTSPFENLTITGSGAITIGSDIAIGGGSLSISGATQVNFNGDITNDGTFSVSIPAVFNGGAGQAVDGTSAVSFTSTVTFSNSMNFDVAATFGSTISAGNNALSFEDDFTNNGTFNSTGTVTFDGTSSQSITGSSATSFENLTISNTTATVTIGGGGTSVEGVLTVANGGALATGGVLTLVSDASGAVSVADLTGATVSGNVNYERYFDGSGDVWRNFGIAVSAGLVTDITSAGYTVNGNDLAYYNEATDAWVNQDAFGSSLSNNRGYSLYTRAENGNHTISFKGSLNTGTQNPTVTRGGSGGDTGWNLVNNPYASTIDFDLLTRANLDNNVAVWNTAGSAYVYWNGSTGSLTNGLISSGQGFWVHSTSGTPSLTINENDKSSSSSSFLRTSSLTNHLVISLLQDEKVDKTFIHFRDDATDNFDTELDGLKLSNGIYNLSSLASSGESLSINSLPFSECDKTIKFNMTNISEGTYKVKFEDLVTFETAFTFTLVDNFLGNSVILEEGSIIDFNVTLDTASFGKSRFEIQLSAATLDTNILYEVNSTCDFTSSIMITNAQIGVDYTLVQNGVDIISKKALSATLVFPLSENEVIEGVNKFDINLLNGTCGAPTLVTDAIEFSITALQEISIVTNGESCGNGQVLLSASGALGNAYYNWYESIESNDAIPNQNSNEFLTPDLESSKFYYVSITNESGCESEVRVKVTADIKTPPSTDILYLEANPCDISSNITIANAEIGTTYNLMQNGQIIVAEEAISNELVLPLNQQQINEGTNKFDLRVESSGCSSDLANAVEFEYFSIKEVVSVTNGKSCTAGSVVLVAEGANSGDHYNWYESNDAVEPIAGKNTNEFVSPVLDETRTYYVSVVNANGCESISRVEVVAEIVNLDQPDILMVNDVVSTTAIAENYKWFKDGEILDNENGQSITLVESGVYSVEIESSGCIVRSIELPATILALEQLEELGVKIYPNPVIDMLTISGGKEKIKSIIIYDTKGVAVYRSGNTIPSEINLISIKKGIYIINIATDNKTINYRVRKK